ncbi:MAG: alpha/beta hydrolase family protein [Gammaproteobacteria bacterium]
MFNTSRFTKGEKMSLKRAWIQITLLAIWCFNCAACSAQLLRPQDVNKLPAAPADYRIRYGSDPIQFADLRLPSGKGPFPVAIIIHGGCWMKLADLQHTAPMSDALRHAGLATWNIEYRRVDDMGGGWPGTFHDVGAAVDHLKTMAKTYKLDLTQVIVVGHSAGGHLALWVAARHHLPKTSPLFVEKPLPVRGAVNLGGPGDLQSFLPAQKRACGDVPITKLVGGLPSEVAQRYRDASPAELLPLGVKQILITGTKDLLVPPKYGKEYEAAAQKSGDEIEMIEIENAGHFEVIAPNSTAWPTVERAVLSLVRFGR